MDGRRKKEEETKNMDPIHFPLRKIQYIYPFQEPRSLEPHSRNPVPRRTVNNQSQVRHPPPPPPHTPPASTPRQGLRTVNVGLDLLIIGWLAMPETQRYIGQTHDATIMGQSTQRCVGGQRHNAVSGRNVFSRRRPGTVPPPPRHRPGTGQAPPRHRAAPQARHRPATAPPPRRATAPPPRRAISFHFTFEVAWAELPQTTHFP